MPSVLGPELPPVVAAFAHEGDEVAVGDRHDIEPERGQLHPVHRTLLGPGRELGIGAEPNPASRKAGHHAGIGQPPAAGKPPRLHRGVALSQKLHRLENGLAPAILVLQRSLVPLRQQRLLQQIGLLQRLQHSLADIGHEVEPLVVGADRLMLGIIEEPAFFVVNDAVELGENGAHFGRWLERQTVGVE